MTTWLAVLPWLAFAASLAAVACGILHLRGTQAARAWMRWTTTAAAAAGGLTMLVLIGLFVLVRVDVQYVFLYTSDTIPLRYRIAGAYAGREGSLTLWAFYAATVAALVAWWQASRAGPGQQEPSKTAAGSQEDPTATGAPTATAPPAATLPAAAPASTAGPADAPTLEADAEPSGTPAARMAAQPRPPETSQALLGPRSQAWTELLLAAVAAAFLGAVAMQELFAPTSDFLLRNRPGGNGLNPTLLSPFILIHPPVMFLAYALTAVPLAAVVADQITGAQAWSRTGMLWSRIDWLLYTFAMGLGGIWAYYTLGFGGYWAWDPVEVANLLPWLALTLFLHAQLHHRRHGSYRHLGPLLGVLPFLLTIFSTISTRSGLWVSVHAFTDPTGTFDPDAGRRILSILEREPGLQFHAALFLAVLLAFLALWGRRLAIDTGRLAQPARVVAGVLGAAAVVAAVAPNFLLSLALEAGALLTGGRAGYGLLALAALAVLAPAAPLLIGDEATRRARLDLRTLNLAAVTVLGVGLLVMFLWHIAAANGWSTQAYIARFPLLAVPAMLGLLVLQAHALWRRNALWLAAGIALAAGLAYTVDVLWSLLAIGLPLVAISLLRVLRAARVRGVPARVRVARSALWIAALLNVAFWLNPPTVRLGATEWQPVWPAQLVLGGASFLGLHLATQLLVGRTRDQGAAHLVVGLLGGFYIAPAVAAASWWVHRRTDHAASSPARRLHQVGLYGIHLAVAVALLGYTLTTYVGTSEELLLSTGEQATVGDAGIRLLQTDQVAQGALVERFEPVLHISSGAETQARGVLYWEPQGSSHYPLPATARFWHGDVYFAVDAVCIDASGTCDDARDWIRAYDVGSRMPAGLTVTQVELQVFTLPGIALVWTALFAWLYFMGLVMLHGPERAR